MSFLEPAHQDIRPSVVIGEDDHCGCSLQGRAMFTADPPNLSVFKALKQTQNAMYIKRQTLETPNAPPFKSFVSVAISVLY